MAAFTLLYGVILVLVLIFGGLAYMVSPSAGQQVIKRVGISVLLFSAGAYLLHCGSGSLLGRTARILAAGALFVASVLWMVYPTGASELIRRTAVLALASIGSYFAFTWLWMDLAGRLLLCGLVLVVIAAGFARTRSS